MRSSLRERAVGVLRDNDRGRHTVPSSKLYPHHWAWDSAFAAIGWAHIDLERGCQELESILAGQWADGRIPHIQFSKTVESYFPGPESWGKEHSSTISNPPVWALAAKVLLQKGAEADRVRTWLPKIERSLEFLKAHRDPLSWNCIATCHPWENGQDNCPAWDKALEAVDPEEAPPFQRVDVKKVADPGQRPTDLQYKRYMALVHRFTQNGFQPANFVVYDPFFTTLTILSEEAQARMCEALHHPTQASRRANALREGLQQHLWAPSSVATATTMHAKTGRATASRWAHSRRCCWATCRAGSRCCLPWTRSLPRLVGCPPWPPAALILIPCATGAGLPG